MKVWWWAAASFAASPSPYWKNTAQLLQDLDRRGIRYPPTATRVELEALWHAAGEDEEDDDEKATMVASSVHHLQDNKRPYTSSAADSSTTNVHPMNETTIAEHEHRRRRRQRRHQRASSTLFGQRIPSYANTLKATAGDILDQGYRQVRRVKRDIVEAWMEAEDGVRTVPYEYVERFDDVWNRREGGGNNNKSSYRHGTDGKKRRSSEAGTFARENDDEEEDAYPRSARRPPPQPRRPPRPSSRQGGAPTASRTARRRPANRQHQHSSRPVLLLPPAQGTFTSSEAYQSLRPKKRKIYNPYGEAPSASSSPHVNTNDLLDEIGAFFVEAADRAMGISNSDAAVAGMPANGKQQQWPQQQQQQQQDPPPQSPPQSPQREARPSKRIKKKKKTKKHWKDQWEERFDYMFGLHDDKEPYRRWTDGPAPPEPIVPSPWGQGQRRRSNDSRDDPFWGRGSILSLVLSRHEPQLYPWDRVDALWEADSGGSVLSLLRWTARGVARMYGKVCRWAAYHETLPQAAVVTFVTAILLSTSKRRLLAAAIALVTTRAIGESVRGEITPWDDDDDEEEEYAASADVGEELPPGGVVDKGVVE